MHKHKHIDKESFCALTLSPCSSLVPALFLPSLMDPLASFLILPTSLPYLDLPHHPPAHPPKLWKTSPASQSLPHPPVVFPPDHSKAILYLPFGTFTHLDSLSNQPLYIQLLLPPGPLCIPVFSSVSLATNSVKIKSYFFIH